MDNIPQMVLKRLTELLPEFLKNDTVAFCFGPPKQKEHSDIVIATKRGELIEIKDREIVRKIDIDYNIKVKDIILHKRKYAKYFTYILQAENAVYIVEKDDTDLKVLKKYSNITNVDLEDLKLDGNVRVKLWYMDDAIPVILNDDYCIESEIDFDDDNTVDDGGDGLCLLMKEKLAQVKHQTQCNKKILEEKRQFRQELMNLCENMERFDRDGTKPEDVKAVDKLTVGKTWMKIHNQKVVIGIPLENTSNGSIDDIQLIIKSNEIQTFLYSTKLYTIDKSNQPYWNQMPLKIPTNSKDVVCAAIFDVPTFENVSSVVIEMALAYTHNEKSLCIPLEDVNLKAIDVVNFKYDPIVQSHKDLDSEDILSVIVSSFYENLIMHPVENHNTDLNQFFTDKLLFKKRKFRENDNILIHCNSPTNILHGAMLFHNEETNTDGRIVYSLNVYARSESQMLMFINLMYDQIPLRCAIAPKRYNLMLKSQSSSSNLEESMDISEETPIDDSNKQIVTDIALLIHQQVAAVVQHLEKCIEAMSEERMNDLSANACDKSIHIDVNALGNDKYKSLWDDLIDNMFKTCDLWEKLK